MTFDEWCQDADNFFEILGIKDFPKWYEWKRHIEEVLHSMDYETGMKCKFNELLRLAKISNEVSRAKKELIIHNRKEQLEQDFS